MIDPEQIMNRAFWEDDEPFLAGEWEGEIPDLPEDAGSVLFRTSGSTGGGKWVVVGKRALLVSARAVNEWLGVDSGSVWGLALPLNHVGGFGVVARAFSAQCGLAVFGGKWDARGFAGWGGRERVSHVSLVPTQLHDLVEGGHSGWVGLEAVVVGAGRLSDELGQRARDAGWPALASYGMTEACSQVATQSLELLGTPYKDSPLRILPVWDARLTAQGLLEIRGEALFAGTLEGGRFLERNGDWFRTNDRMLLGDGCLRPLGRADLLVKVMGELVDVERIERRFMEICAGRIAEGRFAVVPVDDARRGHALVAVFEAGSAEAEDCFKDYQRVADGMERFASWLVVEEMPRSELGKLRRGELRRMVAPDG